jgi:hypothetical protein
MKVIGPANKRSGVKKGLTAPHPKKTDDKFGSKTDYAKFSTTKVAVTGKKK